MGGLWAFGRLCKLAFGRSVRCRSLIALCVSLELGGAGLATAGPLLLKSLVDSISDRSTNETNLVAIILAFIVAWTGPSVITAWRNVYSSHLNGIVTQHLIAGALRGVLQRVDSGTADSAEVLGRLERLNSSVAEVMEGLVWRLPPLALQFILALVVMVEFLSWKYLSILTGLAAAFVFVSWRGAQRQTRESRKLVDSAGVTASLIGDILRNADRVVSNGAIEPEVAAAKASLTLRNSAVQSTMWSFVCLNGMQFGVTTIGMVALLWMGAVDVARHLLTTGDFILLQAYGLRLAMPMAGAGYILNQSAASLANIGDVFGMQMETDGEPTWCRGLTPGRAIRLRAEGLSYAYRPDRPTLTDICVEFPASSFSVLVGRNGSGKSTLAKLLAGRLNPQSGSVVFDDTELSSIPPCLRHEVVLYVPQRATLMNRSLRSNLLYPPYSGGEMPAVQHLYEWDFDQLGRAIDLDVKVGEGGRWLSGGQVQKLEMARLTGVNVGCVILDETTSAMDPASETKAIAALRHAYGTRTTTVLVTHRAKIADLADQVVWMADGAVSAVGGHQDLLLKYQAYRDLWGVERDD